VEFVQRYENIRVADLAEQLDVSKSTICSDLEALHEQGQLIHMGGSALGFGNKRKLFPPHSLKQGSLKSKDCGERSP
jgi:DeoR/GlpR family transcriptional regulator of sugar metabolism